MIFCSLRFFTGYLDVILRRLQVWADLGRWPPNKRKDDKEAAAIVMHCKYTLNQAFHYSYEITWIQIFLRFAKFYWFCKQNNGFGFLPFAIFYGLYWCHVEESSGLGKFRPMATYQTKSQQWGIGHSNSNKQVFEFLDSF